MTPNTPFTLCSSTLPLRSFLTERTSTESHRSITAFSVPIMLIIELSVIFFDVLPYFSLRKFVTARPLYPVIKATPVPLLCLDESKKRRLSVNVDNSLG